MSIPQLETVAGLISAIAIMQFSYTFPSLLLLAWWMHKDAMAGDGKFTPYTGPQRIDSWKQWSRWRRAFFSGTHKLGPYQVPSVLGKTFLLLLTLACFSMAGLGMYGSGESIAQVFDQGGATGTSFGCASPV